MLQRLLATSLGIVLYVLGASASHALLVDFTFDVTLDTGEFAGETFTGTFTLDGFTGNGVEVFTPEGSDVVSTGEITAFEIFVFDLDLAESDPLIVATDGAITVIDYRGDDDNDCCPGKFGSINIDFSPQINTVGIDGGCCGNVHDLPAGTGTVTDIAFLPKINDYVTFEPDPSTYSFTRDISGCPNGFVGKFGFEASLTNISESMLFDLLGQVAESSNGNLLLTPDGTIGEGGVFPIPTENDYFDELLGPAEYVDVPFTMCLNNTQPFTFFVDVLGTGRNLSHTPWMKHEGEEVVPFGFEAPDHGWEGEYDFASIPAEGDAGWEPAPDPQLIDYTISSTLCGVISCREGAYFTYFQTFVDVPAGVEPKTFSIRLDGIDDGVQVSIFNSDNTDGAVAGYVFLGEAKTIDLKTFIKSGEKNRVVLTHTDDCCSESFLQFAELTIVLE